MALGTASLMVSMYECCVVPKKNVCFNFSNACSSVFSYKTVLTAYILDVVCLFSICCAMSTHFKLLTITMYKLLFVLLCFCLTLAVFSTLINVIYTNDFVSSAFLTLAHAAWKKQFVSFDYLPILIQDTGV